MAHVYADKRDVAPFMAHECAISGISGERCVKRVAIHGTVTR
jgi:hypothetical protein